MDKNMKYMKKDFMYEMSLNPKFNDAPILYLYIHYIDRN